jgi:TolB-like protein/Tfp pilus assembly protein PilF
MFLAWRFDIGPGGIRRTAASSARGRATIVAAVMLMVGATAGLFYLIYPSVTEQAGQPGSHPYTQVEFREDAIAVLPFKLASGDPNDRYMSDGVAYELRAQLGRVDGVTVAAETSSTAFRGQNVLAQEISQRLGVGRLIEGSLMRQGESLRISVQIIDGSSGLQTWSEAYEGSIARLLDIQQEIAVDVARELVAEGGSGVVVPDPVTQSASAYDLMLRARFLEQEIRDEQIVDLEKHRRVVDYYRRATEADPTSAIAFSRLASAYLYVGDVASANAPIFRALTLDPELSDVQNTLGHYYWLTNQELAGEAYREAIRLDPENVDALGAFGSWMMAQAEADKAVEYFRRALNLDQESLERYRDLGAYYGATGKRDAALSLAQDIQLRFDDVRSYQVLARIYEQTGDVDVAIAWVRMAVQRDPDNPEFKWQLAELYSRIGDADSANLLQPEPGLAQLYWQRRYDELIEAAEEAMIDYPNELPIRYLLAFAYNVKGRYEEAASVLERSGLPDRAYSSSRFAAAVEALMTLANAWYEMGRVDEAEQAAAFVLGWANKGIETGMDTHYWPYLYSACVHSITGRYDQALASIRSVTKTWELVWEPVLRDAPCFRQFKDHPDYVAVLDDLAQRQAELRERLPDTLDRFAAPTQ